MESLPYEIVHYIIDLSESELVCKNVCRDWYNYLRGHRELYYVLQNIEAGYLGIVEWAIDRKMYWDFRVVKKLIELDRFDIVLSKIKLMHNSLDYFPISVSIKVGQTGNIAAAKFLLLEDLMYIQHFLDGAFLNNQLELIRWASRQEIIKKYCVDRSYVFPVMFCDNNDLDVIKYSRESNFCYSQSALLGSFYQFHKNQLDILKWFIEEVNQTGGKITIRQPTYLDMTSLTYINLHSNEIDLCPDVWFFNAVYDFETFKILFEKVEEKYGFLSMVDRIQNYIYNSSMIITEDLKYGKELAKIYEYLLDRGVLMNISLVLHSEIEDIDLIEKIYNSNSTGSIRIWCRAATLKKILWVIDHRHLINNTIIFEFINDDEDEMIEFINIACDYKLDVAGTTLEYMIENSQFKAMELLVKSMLDEKIRLHSQDRTVIRRLIRHTKNSMRLLRLLPGEYSEGVLPKKCRNIKDLRYVYDHTTGQKLFVVQDMGRIFDENIELFDYFMRLGLPDEIVQRPLSLVNLLLYLRSRGHKVDNDFIIEKISKDKNIIDNAIWKGKLKKRKLSQTPKLRWAK